MTKNEFDNLQNFEGPFVGPDQYTILHFTGVGTLCEIPIESIASEIDCGGISLKPVRPIEFQDLLTTGSSQMTQAAQWLHFQL